MPKAAQIPMPEVKPLKKEITKFPEGSIEAFFNEKCNMSPKILKLEYTYFFMKLEDDELIFKFGSQMADNLYYKDFIADDEAREVNFLDFILSPYNQDSFDIVAKNANRLRPELIDRYDIEDFDRQFELMCVYALNFYMYKFRDIKSLKDIDRPIPIQLFVNLLKKDKNLEVIAKDEDNNEFAGILQHASIQRSMFSANLIFDIQILSKGRYGYKIGTTRITRPLPYMVQTLEDVGLARITLEDKVRLTERGRKYIEYTRKPSYCFYNGFGHRYGGWFGDVRVSVNGRVMVDAGAMRALNSNIDDDWYVGNLFENEGCTDNVSEDSLWMCSPVVYGFSFVTKDWIRMQIENMSDIAFSDKAIDELIVPETYKNIFLACLNHNMPSLDSIEGKGNGKIFLLYGPPGVGKTMSAEAVAEYKHKPLYYVSVGELGTSPEAMEQNLSNVMEVAQSWDAIVLLDEVDVFAVKRTGSDIKRNAMTAILLRLLERFNGIMFMTTNLLDNLDEAFISRATATIPYENLTTSDRTTIWTSLLNKAEKSGIEIDPIVYESIKQLAQNNINGRTIKNIIRLSYSVAMNNENRVITMDILKAVMSLRTA